MWSTWGASPWEGKSGAEVGIVNTKVARRARAGQTFPHWSNAVKNILFMAPHDSSGAGPMSNDHLLLGSTVSAFKLIQRKRPGGRSGETLLGIMQPGWWLCLANAAVTPPPPVPRNRLAQEPHGSAVEFSHYFFLPRYWVFHGSGGCRTAIQVCRTTFHERCYGSPPSGVTLSVSHRRTYPLNPSPLLSTPSPKQPAPDKETNKSQLNTGGH